MTRRAVVSLAKRLGWKPWGKLRPYKNGTKYQCFRRGKSYAWIGNYYAERNDCPFSQEYVNTPKTRLLSFLS